MQTQPFCHYLVAYSNIMQSECTILPYHTDRYYRIVPTDIIVSHIPTLPYRAAPITLGCYSPLRWGTTPHYAGVLRPITHTAAGKAAHMLKTEQDIRFSYNSLKFPRHPHSYSLYTFSSALRLLHFGRHL